MTKEDIKQWLVNDGQVPEGCENNEYWSHWYDVIHRMLQGQSLPIDGVVGSYNLKVGDKIKMPSGLRAEVIKTKVKVKDEFGGEYYLSDIEVG